MLDHKCKRDEGNRKKIHCFATSNGKIDSSKNAKTSDSKIVGKRPGCYIYARTLPHRLFTK